MPVHPGEGVDVVSEQALIDMIRENPFDKDTRLVAADWFEEHGNLPFAEALRVGKIPLFALEVEAVAFLSGSNMTPGSWDERFVRDLTSLVTPRQFIWIWLLVRRYRRQYPSGAVKAYSEANYKRFHELQMQDLVFKESRPKNGEP